MGNFNNQNGTQTSHNSNGLAAVPKAKVDLRRGTMHVPKIDILEII